MYRKGHLGLALLFGAPVGFVLGLIGPVYLTVVGIGSSLMMATLPDVDQQLPIRHRGVTHTFLFAGAVSFAMGLLTLQVLLVPADIMINEIPAADVPGYVYPIALAATIGYFTGLTSHILGDTLTVSYSFTINPFWPVSDRSIRLGWTTADSTIWNWGLLALGIIAAGMGLGGIIVLTRIL